MRIKTTLGITTFALLPFLMAGCSDNDVPGAAFTITTTGGVGGLDNGSGGNGEYVELRDSAGLGETAVLKSGRADASFSSVTPATNLGANPLTITASTTVAVETVEPAAGTAYLVANNTNLFISDGNGTLESAELVDDRNIATGISVASGATLTLGLNSSGATLAYVSLRNDISNSGTITTLDASATARGDLRLDPAAYVGATGSSITTAGTADGMDGGDVQIYANLSTHNHGTISTRGSDSTTTGGGDGGVARLYGWDVQNTADITTRGGDSTAGTGGNSGNIILESSDGAMQNSGNLSAFGGNGTTGGGSSNNVRLESWAGNALNSGDIDTHGGNSSAAGNAGNGGYVRLWGYGFNTINSGDITTVGGNATAEDQNGGNGGEIYFYNEYADISSGYTAGGNLEVSGNLDASGGDAVSTVTSSGDGGSASDVYAENYGDYYNYGTSRLVFLGYSSVTTSGGDGNFGGSAGDYTLTGEYGQNETTDDYTASGNVTNEANLVARGGNVVATATTTPANGGGGGDFTLETDYYYGYQVPELNKVTNTGTADLSSGNNLKATSQNTSGSVWFWGYNGVTNLAALTTNGGDDPDTDGGVTGYGNYANDIDIESELGSITNKAALTSNGGDGEYVGGGSGGIYMSGTSVSSQGNLSANGGNASATLTDSVGGDGGWIEFYAYNRGSASQSGTVSHTAGTGDTTSNNTQNAQDGAFVKEGRCISGICN